jgi:hypothetical protein
MTKEIPQIVKDAVDEFIARYGPALTALEHGDLGHKIKWLAPDHMRCSCGIEKRSK